MVQPYYRFFRGLAWSLLLVLQACLSAGCSLTVHATKPADAEGFVELFNGKDLTGWQMLGPGELTVENGTLRAHGGAGSMGFLWYDRKKFRDFVLIVEWSVASIEDDSGVFVRFPNPPQTPRQIELEGYEIQILDSWGHSGTGAIIYLNAGGGYSVEGTGKTAARKPGEWNRMEIIVVDQDYSVVLNGEKVLDFTGDRGRDGYIGIQSHAKPVTIRFRSIRIKELPAGAASPQ